MTQGNFVRDCCNGLRLAHLSQLWPSHKYQQSPQEWPWTVSLQILKIVRCVLLALVVHSFSFLVNKLQFAPLLCNTETSGYATYRWSHNDAWGVHDLTSYYAWLDKNQSQHVHEYGLQKWLIFHQFCNMLPWTVHWCQIYTSIWMTSDSGCQIQSIFKLNATILYFLYLSIKIELKRPSRISISSSMSYSGSMSDLESGSGRGGVLSSSSKRKFEDSV